MAHTKMTKESILRKVNRKRNPVKSLVQLAHEFGVRTSYTRSDGTVGTGTPGAFRDRVRRLVGTRTYNRIRSTRSVNHRYQ